MKYIFLSIVVMIGLLFLFGMLPSLKDDIQGLSTNIYDYSANSIKGEEISLGQYKGKKILIVNVASKCGYTYQYEGLQKLHEQYGDKLEVIAFPANNFLFQEPGTNNDIITFCKSNYGVTFQMFEKISVKGMNKHPIYKWLSNKELNGIINTEPSWNFCKYLIDENGKLLKFYDQKVKPLSEEIINQLK